MSKRFFKLTSLFMFLAMALCLTVVGCSEGDNRPSSLPSGTTLDVTMGWAPLTKQYDCPTATDYFDLLVQDENNNLIASQGYAEIAVPTEDILAWTTSADGTMVSLNMEITSADLAKSPSRIVVVAYDKDGNYLGYYSDVDLTFVTGVPTECDFTEDGAPAFTSAKDSLGMVTVNDVDENDTITIDVTKSATISATANIMCTSGATFTMPADGFELINKSLEEYVTVNNEKGTVTGVGPSIHNRINLLWNNLMTGFYVDVMSEKLFVSLYEVATELSPDFAAGDEVTVTPYVNDEEKASVTWKGSRNHTILLDEVKANDSVKVICKYTSKATSKTYATEVKLEKVSADNKENVIAVIAWKEAL